jgi:hypothetical protein
MVFGNSIAKKLRPGGYKEEEYPRARPPIDGTPCANAS